MKDSIKSPKIEAIETIKEIIKKCFVCKLSKVIKDRKFTYDKINEEKTLKNIPPLTPSHVLFGDIFGQNNVFPNIEPINSAPLSVYQADTNHIKFKACPYLY